MKKYLPLNLLRYFYNSLTGSFFGFMAGTLASSFVSRFFATRSIHNLWGLSSHKTILDKNTYGRLEWIVSILIGYLVFEVINKILKPKLDELIPRLKVKFFRWLISKELHLKLH